MTEQSFPGSSAGKESACNIGDSSSIPGSGRSAGEGIDYPLQDSWASLVTQMVKNLPAVRESWVLSLCWENPWRRNGDQLQYCGLENPMDGGAWWATVHEVAKSQTRLDNFHWRLNNNCLGCKTSFLGLPMQSWASQVVLGVKNLPASAGDMRLRFDPWVRKTPWRRKWQPTPVSLCLEDPIDRGA